RFFCSAKEEKKAAMNCRSPKRPRCWPSPSHFPKNGPRPREPVTTQPAGVLDGRRCAVRTGLAMRFHRRTTTRVVGGLVRQKNRWREDPDSTATHQVRIERFTPPPGYRHFVSPADVTAFLALLPDWRELAIGLQRVVLSAQTECQGWHRPGTVALCA